MLSVAVALMRVWHRLWLFCRGVAGTEYQYSLQLMGESFIGLTGADGARESRPELGVSSDMRAARPASICGLSNLNRPSAPPQKFGTYMLCKVGSTRKPLWNASYSATLSRAWRVSSASTAQPNTGSFATAAGTRHVVAACTHPCHLRRTSTACAHNATTAERTPTADRRAPAKVVV
jgi:hypothetical protein